MTFFNKMKLGTRLPLMIVVPALFVVLGAGVLQLWQTATVMENDKERAYESYILEKRKAVETWLNEAKIDVIALADSYAITSAMQDFSSAWDVFGASVSAEVRRLYISDNPNPLGKKDELEYASDGSLWSEAHARHHVGLRSFQRARGYYDLFLFDMDGNLVYSVFKEDDFALNFRQGQYADTGLGEVFRAGRDLDRGAFYMTSIAPYAPSADAPAMFMSTPIFNNGRQIGVVAVQLPLDVLTSLISDAEILGKSGQVYLVDDQGRALTSSRHEGGFSTLDQLPKLEHIQAALNGNKVYFGSTPGINGNTVVAKSHSIVTPRGDNWGMVFEIDRNEATQFIQSALLTSLIELAVMAGLLSLLVWAALRGVINRVEGLASEMDAIAAQNYDQQIVGQDREDEIGFISRTLANLQVRLREGADAQAREKKTQVANEAVVKRLSATLLNLAKGDFRNRIDEFFPEEHKKLRYSINDAMEALSEVIESVRATAESINQGAQEISSSADDLSSRTESQASTLEQTAASLEEVTKSVESAAERVDNVEVTVNNARKKAEVSGEVVNETIEAMMEIEDSSQKTNQIIGVIDDIAFQTNLLALNAGVEAARAGDAGRGFAVVASEVRSLAQRSSGAAMEIKSLIETSGQQVARGVQMVGKTGESLSQIVGEVREISGLVQQIAQSSRQQSKALNEINSGMSQLDQATQGNAAMAEENTAAAHLLRADASSLIELVGQFQTSTSKKNENAAVSTPAPFTPKITEKAERAPVEIPPAKDASGAWVEF